jgi:hypothetical protein
MAQTHKEFQMKIHDVLQGSPKWLEARMGVCTASEMDAIVSPLGKVREGKGVESYVALKLAEKWRGCPLPSFSGGAMEQGSLRESDALPWFEMWTGIGVKRVGFITTDDGMAGCSPDGLLSDDEGLEIKCPQPPAHVKYLLDGGLPEEYVLQVQTSIYVTGAKEWRFLSYCPGFPKLLLTIDPYPKIQASIRQAVATFSAMMDEGWKRLVELNGGEGPIRRKPDDGQEQLKKFWEEEFKSKGVPNA